MAGGSKAIVVGAGIGGLAAAMALSRVGWQVVLVERDDTPMPDDVEGAFEWDRRGAPQVRHTHGFPALIRCILRDRYPDVLEALVAAGVGELSIMPPSVPTDAPDYERDAADLQVLCCRRTTLEWVLRRCALAEPNVELRVGVGVAGLVLGRPAGDGPLDVRGVRLDDGTELSADAVVASTGRRGDVPAWFAAHGVTVPEEEHPTGTVYLSRFYRSAAGAEVPMGYQGGRRAGLGFVVAGADNGTYSATLAVDADDAELRAHLLDPERFEAVLPLFREMEPVVRSGGTPITPVQVMGGLINRIRRFVEPDGTPLAHGFFAIGDAHTCTNPLYGRGSSLAVLQATLVADAVADHPVDRDEASRAYETWSAARVEPWFDVSLLTDAAAKAPSPDAPALEPAPAAAPAAPRLDLATLRRIAASGDPELAVLVAKTMSLLLTPQEVFGNPQVLERLATAAATERPVDPTRPSRTPLTRDDLLAAVRRPAVTPAAAPTGDAVVPDAPEVEEVTPEADAEVADAPLEVDPPTPTAPPVPETQTDVEPTASPAGPSLPMRFVAAVLGVVVLAVLVGAMVLRGAATDDGSPEASPEASPDTSVVDRAAPPVRVPTSLRGQVDEVGGAAPVTASVNVVQLAVSPAGLGGELHLQIDGAAAGGGDPTGGCFAVDIDLGATPLPTVTEADGSLTATGPVEVIIGYADDTCASGAARDSDGRPGTLVVTIADGVASGSVSFGDPEPAMSFSAVAADA